MFMFDRFTDAIYFQAYILEANSLKDLQRYLIIRHRKRVPIAYVLDLVIRMSENPTSVRTDLAEDLRIRLKEKVARLLKNKE